MTAVTTFTQEQVNKMFMGKRLVYTWQEPGHSRYEMRIHEIVKVYIHELTGDVRVDDKDGHFCYISKYKVEELCKNGFAEQSNERFGYTGWRFQ